VTLGLSPHLREALALTAVLHEPGQRERYRRLLDAAIEHAERALGTQTTEAGVSLATAHAAKAEDALHGANQLSLSAQRAPTREACEEGWRRVAAIVAGAEVSARVAASMARSLEDDAPPRSARAARLAAGRAAAAAESAARILAERNHAYTFHADDGFSFGEGWYLAAAAVLAGVSIQIEPGQEGTFAAEKFLRDAGLAERLVPYRSRPRAMKHTTELVARAFRLDPTSARERLRAAFLGADPVPVAVRAWLEQRLRSAGGVAAASRKVLLWIREGAHHPGRNTNVVELVELTRRVRSAGLVPVLIGDAFGDAPLPEGSIDMTLFWRDPVFRQADRRRAQLSFFEELKGCHGVVGQIGVTTAGMDGPALMGLPTLYLTDAPNVRMRQWVGAVPGYAEVLRDGEQFDRISRVLETWGAFSPKRSGATGD
jgi:hypothetical protein